MGSSFKRIIECKEEKKKIKNIHRTYRKKPKGICPKCRKKSLFFTNDNGEIFCIRCNNLVSNRGTNGKK